MSESLASRPSYCIHRNIISCVQTLPDRKFSVEDIAEVAGYPREGVGKVLEELVLFGELNLCSPRRTGGMVWYKHRKPTLHYEYIFPDSVWMAYLAIGPRNRISDRIFRTREEGIEFLSRSISIPKSRFRPVPYLLDVYFVQVASETSDSDNVAVVRPEPIFSTDTYQRQNVVDDPNYEWMD